MTAALIAAIVLLAALLAALSGFGFALIVMPILALLLGLRTAAPLVALAGLTLCTINVVRYRRGIDGPELLRLAAASACGLPLGLWLLGNVDEGIVQPILGAILVAYAAYALLRRAPVAPCSRHWGVLAGFLAGCLGGAYNTPGPPVVVYGALRQWPKGEFRGTLQALFVITGAIVATSHAIAGHVTADVLQLYAVTAPALLLGVVAAALVDGRVNQVRFRTLVASLILATGVALLMRIS